MGFMLLGLPALDLTSERLAVSLRVGGFGMALRERVTETAL